MRAMLSLQEQLGEVFRIALEGGINFWDTAEVEPYALHAFFWTLWQKPLQA